MAEILKVIGLMSGTSLDGVDAALLETDGETVARPGPALTLSYDTETRALLRVALDLAAKMRPGDNVPDVIVSAEQHLTERHAEAVRTLLEKVGGADLIGFHGQTILHRPDQRWTWQIGDGALLARLTGIDVINDFRSADVAAGGQGAPLMPLYHAAMARRTGLAEPLVVVNIGGVAQVTYINGETILAFDTGPGNAPIDDWMQRHTGKPVDENGALAATGRIDEWAMDVMLDDPFFAKAPPKSLDRMDFGTKAVEWLSPADGAATLTAFTAGALARAAEHFPQIAKSWIVSGGGRHNNTLMEMLKDRVGPQVVKADDVGWNGDALEAEGFAYLAMRAKRGLPLSLPTTTGVKQPMTGGRYWKP
jgi:anhydro-N-acetylmuramic acid kinase